MTTQSEHNTPTVPAYTEGSEIRCSELLQNNVPSGPSDMPNEIPINWRNVRRLTHLRA